MSIKTFYLEPTGRQQIWLRRYRSDAESPCRFHDRSVLIGSADESKDERGYINSVPAALYEGDPRWPVQCQCGYEFVKADPMQVLTRSIFRRTDTAEEMTLEDAPPGAIWNAWWMADCFRERSAFNGEDGLCLSCKMPGGHVWNIDGRASNCDSPCVTCTRPYHAHAAVRCATGFKEARPHQCWVRHGSPQCLTVDKNGVTCGAGAGSILVSGWHGFLRNGVLSPC